jgi:hypothetical protein
LTINIPHTFPSLIEGENVPVLILGAGASYGLAPSPNELFPNKCLQAEKKLGCCSGIDFNNLSEDDKLYTWAEAIIRELERGGEQTPKLKMAEELEILSDARWQPQVSRRALQTLPRHRVIARFVREERWRAIWSLNWDTYLETALESIGIFPDTDQALNDFPWTNKYRAFVTDDDYAVADNVFKLHKPHGCVRSLIHARKALENGNPSGAAERLSERFLITSNEMASLRERATNQDYNFYSNIRDVFSGHSLYTLGWKAEAEGYLLESLELISSQLRTGFDDSLCVINRTFYENGGLATIYNRSNAQSHVATADSAKLDELFLWLQAKYCLKKLMDWVDDEDERTGIQGIIDSINPPDPDNQRLIYDWADSFLPAWIRLCWRTGLVDYYYNGHLLSPYDIRMESPDEHIPLFLDGAERVDIKSSIPLLLSLIGKDAYLDLRMYPGALYRASDRTLIVPMPGWSTSYNDLEGLKPLLEEVKQKRSFGYIERIVVLPIGYDSAPVLDGAQYILPHKLANKMDAIPFAEVDGIVSITLEDITGGGHA